VKVARVLLDAGAAIESVEGDFSRTPLLTACISSRPEVVSSLLQRSANVKAVDKDGWNVLCLACSNGVFGREMIPLLVNAGVDVLRKGNGGRDAMFCALFQSGAMAETLSKFLRLSYKVQQQYISKNDPIGFMVIGAKFGMKARSRDFRFGIQVTVHPNFAGLG
jgi:hypothetical protein